MIKALIYQMAFPESEEYHLRPFIPGRAGSLNVQVYFVMVCTRSTFVMVCTERRCGLEHRRRDRK